MRKRTFTFGLLFAGLLGVHVGCSKLDSASDLTPLAVTAGGTAAAPSGGAFSGGTSALDETAVRSSDAGECTDPTGLSGLGCFSCKPQDITTFENACTTATCTPFNNALRLTKLTADGKLPALPSSAPSGGTPSVITGGGLAGGATSVPESHMGGSTPTALQITVSGGFAGVSSANGIGGNPSQYCDALTAQGTRIYVTGSSAVKPFLQQIAQQLSTLGVFIVYTSTGSCIGVDAILNGTPMTTGAAPAPASAATYWASATDSGTSCDLPSAGVNADLGISDVFAQTCPGFELSNLESNQVREAHGPIQTMTFAVPANARLSEISAQAAYFVFGFGSAGGVLDPSGASTVWDDESCLLQRSASSGTQAMIAAAIGVPPTAWRGKPHKSSDDVAADLQAASALQQTADKTLGILAADYIDSKNLRAQIKFLAYQDSGQPCAFYPDSTASARDKRNVRDGHYPIWSPLHVLYKANASGDPLNPEHRPQILDIVGYLSGTKTLPNGIKLIDLYAQNGLVPECAMHVTRQKDGGNLLAYAATSPCSCLFEIKATGITTCKPCTVQRDCAANETCSLGYCEPQY